MTPKKFLIAIVFLLLTIATKQAIVTDYLNLPDISFNYAITLPAYFTANTGGGPPTSILGLDNTPANNPITNNGATLGRVLFYDKNGSTMIYTGLT
jgi:cytochrome c peroxidase